MRKYLCYVALPLFAVVGALVFLNLFAHVSLRLEALQAGFSVQTSHGGYTILEVPPVGEIRAFTHKGPLSVKISLENVDPDRLKKFLAEGPEQSQVIIEAKKVLNQAVRRLIILSLGLGAAGGLFGLIILQRRKWKEFLLGGLIGLTTVMVLLFGTYQTFDINKFQNPEYDGVLKAAPWMIGLVGESFSTVNTWSKQMRGMAENLYGLFQRVESLQAVSAGEGDLKVLHVSDIHNNPAAFNFIDQVVKTFNVNMIIDSGDLSDFGTPLEAAAFERIKEFRIPYVITPGNHETPAIVGELKKLSNVNVLEEGVIEVDGLKIAGIRDPSSLRNDWKSPDKAEINRFSQRLDKIIKGSTEQPDIIVAHNPGIAEQFWGRAPVVLTGHNHRYSIKEHPASIIINAGTSGASGIGALRTPKEVPYTFVLLHFDRTGDGIRLKYTDTISISNVQSGYSLERKIYPELYNKLPGD